VVQAHLLPTGKGKDVMKVHLLPTGKGKDVMKAHILPTGKGKDVMKGHLLPTGRKEVMLAPLLKEEEILKMSPHLPGTINQNYRPSQINDRKAGKDVCLSFYRENFPFFIFRYSTAENMG
jgi:hypothetical protein